MIEQPNDKNKADFNERRKSFVIFQCPSDTGGFWMNDTGGNPQPPIYWDFGSSFDLNYQFCLNWAAAMAGWGMEYKERKAEYKKIYLQCANAFLSRQLQNHASRFIMLYEDPFDSAQWNNIPRRGWHKQWMKHSFLFLDGHAANILTDTTKGNYGQGWKTAANKWFYNTKDPDYQYRDLGPK